MHPYGPPLRGGAGAAAAGERGGPGGGVGRARCGVPAGAGEAAGTVGAEGGEGGDRRPDGGPGGGGDSGEAPRAGAIIAKRYGDLIPIAEHLEQQGFKLKARLAPAHPWNKTGYLGMHHTKRMNGLSMGIQLSTPEHWSLKQRGEGSYRLDRSPDVQKMTPEQREAEYAKAKVTPQDWAALGAKIPEPVKQWMHEHSVE